MTEKTQPRQNVLPSDVDAQGNVVLWDHGPQEFAPAPGSTEEQLAVQKEQRLREIAQWKAANGDQPVPLRMHQSDAAHAMMTDPGRYSMEPDGLDEGEIEKRIDDIRKRRQAAIDAPQMAIDRKVAIDAIMSDRRAEASVAAAETEHSEAPTPDAIEPEPPRAATKVPVAKFEPKP